MYVVFMGWQGTLKVCFMLFLTVADPEIPPHIWKSSLQHSSCHHSAIADYSHLSPETVGICTRVHLQVPVENIRKYNWVITALRRLWNLEVYQLISSLENPWKHSNTSLSPEISVKIENII